MTLSAVESVHSCWKLLFAIIYHWDHNPKRDPLIICVSWDNDVPRFCVSRCNPAMRLPIPFDRHTLDITCSPVMPWASMCDSVGGSALYTPLVLPEVLIPPYPQLTAAKGVTLSRPGGLSPGLNSPLPFIFVPMTPSILSLSAASVCTFLGVWSTLGMVSSRHFVHHSSAAPPLFVLVKPWLWVKTCNSWSE